MELRFAEATDIPQLLQLLQQVGQVHHNIRPDIFRPGAQKYDEASLLAILADANRPIFVAVDGSRVAGYCFCVVKDYRGSGVQTDRLELYIDDLCVDENCRGTGVATALYRHVTNYARDLGCGFVSLNVWCGNQGAMAFYEKMGLTPRHIMLEMPLEDLPC
jgi:ribosomal protein S18 acetylase RimI-like enzyme